MAELVTITAFLVGPCIVAVVHLFSSRGEKIILLVKRRRQNE